MEPVGSSLSTTEYVATTAPDWLAAVSHDLEAGTRTMRSLAVIPYPANTTSCLRLAEMDNDDGVKP